MKFYLKYKSLYGKSSHIVCLNTFTLHFPNENVLQGTYSSSISVRRVPSSQKKKKNVALKGLIATLTFRMTKRTQSSSISMGRVPSSQKKVALKGFNATLTFIHSSFPNENVLQSTQSSSEMKSSLKLVVVFELFEGVVGFEYIHSSFPDRKRSPEYPIFSEMKSSLK